MLEGIGVTSALLQVIVGVASVLMPGRHVLEGGVIVTGVTVRSIYSVLRVFRASRNTVVFLAQ